MVLGEIKLVKEISLRVVLSDNVRLPGFVRVVSLFSIKFVWFSFWFGLEVYLPSYSSICRIRVYSE